MSLNKWKWRSQVVRKRSCGASAAPAGRLRFSIHLLCCVVVLVAVIIELEYIITGMIKWA